MSITPDPSKIPAAAAADVKAVAPFLPQKVRVVIYTAAGAVGVAATATAPAVGGAVGDILGVVGAACTAIAASTALSHIGK